MYPENWPQCSVCSDTAVDGKETCNRVECLTIVADRRAPKVLTLGVKIPEIIAYEIDDGDLYCTACSEDKIAPVFETDIEKNDICDACGIYLL